MNLNDDDPAQPAYMEGGGDLELMTVDFNPIAFNSTTKEITSADPKATPEYLRAAVLRSTIVVAPGLSGPMVLFKTVSIKEFCYENELCL